MRRTIRMDRAVGVLVLLLAASAAAMLVVGIALAGPRVRQPARRGNLLDVFTFFWDPEAPTLAVVACAMAVALGLAALVTLIELRISNRYRRSADHIETPLAPRVVMAATRGVFHGEVTITVLIPAHNEAERIGATLASLREQEGAPERVIVVADNCTDATPDIAREAGVEVFTTVGNTKKKAGGLNQCLRTLLNDLGENDAVMIMDADTVLDPGYLAAARQRLTADRALMAVGGLFYGEPGAGWLGQCQRNEYLRYSRDIQRRRGRVFVLTGTASVFRARALRTVAALRGTQLPGVPGDVYDTEALTEDNEMTLALKSLGALMVSPPQCRVVTEVMPTWSMLWKQRLRWQRGALENLGAYGITPQTLRYWSQQLGIGYGVVALLAYFVMMLIMAVALDRWVWFPFWAGVGVLFAIERLIGVWKGETRARLLAALVFPELFYAAFLDIVFVKGVVDILRSKQAEWGNVLTDRAAPLEQPGAPQSEEGRLA